MISLVLIYIGELVCLKNELHIEKIAESKKLVIMLMLFGTLFTAIIGRLFYVMYINDNFYKTKASYQSRSDIIISSKRGSILDRNSNELAVSMASYRVDIDMSTLRVSLRTNHMSMDTLTAKLSSILNMDSKKIKNILYMKSPQGNPIKYATLARQINKTQSNSIQGMKLQGLIISDDSRREHIYNNFLASILGYTNAKGNGVSGVEQSYNTELTGIPGRKVSQTDNKKNPLPYKDSKYVAPVDGKNLRLTIDLPIQKFVEDAAEKALKDNTAKSVTITVMNPKNGEILAMVSKSCTNSSGTSTSVKDSLKNNAVQNTFEPGSIFKVITAYAGMEEKVVDDNTIFTCNGSLNVGGTIIHCDDTAGHGTEHFGDIIKYSCNVGFMELGTKLLGEEKLYKYEKLFGFGEKTGIDLPGEATGEVKTPDKTTRVDLATNSFGQGLSVTSVEYLAAFNAVANGGTWIRPHVMNQIEHRDVNNKPVLDKKYDNLGKKTILDKNIAATLRGYLRNVVAPGQNGVGASADVPGLNIAGKTGTAQKNDSVTGGYGAGKYMSSFVGMAPYGDPRITMLVSIDEPNPNKYYAGQVAAPVAHDLFIKIFDYLQSGIDDPLK